MDVFYTCAITSALLSASERLVFCFKATHEDSALVLLQTEANQSPRQPQHLFLLLLIDFRWHIFN